MLIWNTVEVGRNDAAKMARTRCLARGDDSKEGRLARGYCRCGGAMASSPVMETARKGIFDPTTLPGSTLR